MRTFFTADMHLGHDRIIEYCGRPFSSGDQMNKTLVHNWNQRVKSEDVVYHVGDFCFHRGHQGGKNKAAFWESQLNGRIIHILGNHDVNNGVYSKMTHAMFEFGGRVVLAQHVPPTMYLEVPEIVDYVICGHVHERWTVKYLEDKGHQILLVNVGVDVRNFYPVRLDELIAETDKLLGRGDDVNQDDNL